MTLRTAANAVFLPATSAVTNAATSVATATSATTATNDATATSAATSTATEQPLPAPVYQGTIFSKEPGLKKYWYQRWGVVREGRFDVYEDFARASVHIPLYTVYISNINICIYIFVCVNVCMYMHIYTYIYVYICMKSSLRVCAYFSLDGIHVKCVYI